MRADRLIRMLIALQERGRMTAGQLATELEVSVRTVLRDVETLGAAGVPIYAVQGAGGGIEVLDGFRTQLTGFTQDEAAVLFLAGQPAVAAALGLAPAAVAARRKLLLALPPALAATAGELDSWFLHDPVGRRRDDGPTDQQLRLLARAVQAGVEVRIHPGTTTRRAAAASSSSEVLLPLGLILDAGTWYLVHLRGPGPDLRLLTGLSGPTGQSGRVVLGRRFTRPADFDLAGFWHAWSARGGPPGPTISTDHASVPASGCSRTTTAQPRSVNR